MYNIYIYLGYFFAEKYLIEVNTRYIFQWILYFLNNNQYFSLLPSLPLLILASGVNVCTFVYLFI